MASLTAVKSPSTLSALGAAGIRRVIYSSKVRFDSVRPSVFTTPELAAEFAINKRGEMIITKKGVVLNVENLGEARTAQSVRMALRTGFKKRPQYGNASTEQMSGNEDEGGLLWAEFKYNEIKKASRMFMYGYDFNDTEYIDLNGGDGKLHSSFTAENDDTRFQQALLVQYADELTYAPVSASPQFNPNWLIPNLAYADNPAFDHTPVPTITGNGYPDEDVDGYRSAMQYTGATSFVQNICTSLMLAAGATSTPKAVYNVDHAQAIMTYIKDYHIVEPVELDGQLTWIWKMGPKTCGYFFNPSVSGSLGALFTSVAQYQGDVDRDLIPGEFGRLCEDFLIVKDPRTPTLTISGLAAFTMALGYMQPSNNDDRNNGAWSVASASSNRVFEANTILGSNALSRYVRDEQKTNLSELQEYGRIKGSGTYKGEGIQLPVFNIDTPTATSHIYRGSCVVPHACIAVDTVA